MTRVQFLNDLYHHLYGLTQEQAEQHLTYYAEMLADRMEEGMAEEEAVAGMEDVEVIARRIMEEEGLPYTPPEQRPVTPPAYPDASRLKGGGGTRAYQSPKRRSWRKYAQIALWAVAAVAVIGAIGRWQGNRNRSSAAPTPESMTIDAPSTVAEEYAGSWGYFEAPYDIGYGYTEGGNEFDVDAVKSIDIEWAAGMVCIQSWGGDSVQVQEYAQSELNERTRWNVDLNGEELKIRYRNGSGLGNVKGSKWLTVLVPEGMMGEIYVSTTSANVAVSGVELDTLRINTASGEINTGDCYTQTTELSTISGNIFTNGRLWADQADVSTTSGYLSLEMQCKKASVSSISGDINLISMETAEEIEIHTTSGEIWATLDNAAIRAISAGSVSGDISLSLPYELGYTLDFSTVSGDIDLSSFEGSVPSSQNGRYVQNGGECQINVETVSGNFSIY